MFEQNSTVEEYIGGEESFKKIQLSVDLQKRSPEHELENMKYAKSESTEDATDKVGF